MRSARIVTKSRAGSPGGAAGHCTSPILRTASGGIETAMSAKARPIARSPPNITPAGSVTGARVVATSMSTTSVSGALCCDATMRLPIGRPAQPATSSAITSQSITGARGAASQPPRMRTYTEKANENNPAHLTRRRAPSTGDATLSGQQGISKHENAIKKTCSLTVYMVDRLVTPPLFPMCGVALALTASAECHEMPCPSPRAKRSRADAGRKVAKLECRRSCSRG